LLLISGCGGGGGGTTPAAEGQGYVSARVSLQGTQAYRTYLASREAERSAGQSITDSITVAIAISGVYSETGEKFTPVTSTLTIDPDLGYGHTSISKVPIGVNHLLTAAAVWSSGATETVMCIIPQVAAAQTSTVEADQESTIVALTALYYAQQNGITLAAVPAATITNIETAVATLSSQGTSFTDMTPEQVLSQVTAASTPSSIAVSPTSATVTGSGQQQFTATVYNSSGGTLAGQAVTWSVTSTVGTISSSGLFTSSAVGSGTVTATTGTVSGTAAITVAALCTVDTDCDEPDSTTIDTCTNGGTINATCSHTPISVDGTVTSGGTAVADAVVQIYNDTYSDTTLTDATGYYYFTGVPSGTYYIIATKENNTLESSTVTVP